MKSKISPVKFFVLGVLAMLVFRWINIAILMFSENNFEHAMRVFHFAFIIGLGVLIVIGIVLILIND